MIFLYRDDFFFSSIGAKESSALLVFEALIGLSNNVAYSDSAATSKVSQAVLSASKEAAAVSTGSLGFIKKSFRAYSILQLI